MYRHLGYSVISTVSNKSWKSPFLGIYQLALVGSVKGSKSAIRECVYTAESKAFVLHAFLMFQILNFYNQTLEIRKQVHQLAKSVGY